jgi:cytochrome c oxidase assembly factor CtaG
MSGRNTDQHEARGKDETMTYAIRAGGLCLSQGCHPASQLHWGEAATVWTPDPVVLAVVSAAILGYVLGVRRYRRTVGPWPHSRTVCFALAVVLFALATMSFIGAFEKVLFWDRALQNALLLMPTPLLLAASAPVTLATTGQGRSARLLRTVIGSRPMRLLAFPATASLLLLVTPYLLYFTGWYQASLTDPILDEILHLELPVIGFLYFWTRLQLDPVPRRFPHTISVWISFIEGIGDAGVAIVLWLGGGLVAGHYYADLSTLPHSVLYQPLRLGARSGLAWNQAIGGAVFWLVGDLTSIPLLTVLLHGMRREEEHTAAYATRAQEITEIEYAPGDGSAQERFRPWWETDPDLAHRYRTPAPRREHQEPTPSPDSP